MKCHEAEKLFELALDGSLAPATLTRLTEHLAGCAHCRTAYTLLAGLRRSATPAAHAAPDSFMSGLEERIQQERSLGLGRSERWLPRVHFYAADDVSFLRRSRFFLLRNFYRKSAFLLFGEYFRNQDAKRLFRELEELQKELEKNTGKRVPLEEAAAAYRTERLAAFRSSCGRYDSDRDRRLLGRAGAWLRRHRALSGFLPWVIPVVLVAWLLVSLLQAPAVRLTVLTTAAGPLFELQEDAARRFSTHYPVEITLLAADEEALLFAMEREGKLPVFERGADLLLFDHNLLVRLARLGALASLAENRHETLVPAAAALSGPVGTHILPLWAAVPLVAESPTASPAGEHFFFDAISFPVLVSFLADRNGRFPGHAESGRFALLAAQARRGQASLIGARYAENLFRAGRLGRLLCHGHAADLFSLPGVRFRPLSLPGDGIPTAMARVGGGALVAGTDHALEAEAFLAWLAEPESTAAAAIRGLAPLERAALARLADHPRTRHLPDALARSVLLDDPEGYPLWRIAFPVWRVFSLLFIEPDPATAFSARLREVLERKPEFAD